MHYIEEYLETNNNIKVRFWINKNIDRPNVIFIHGLGERLEHFDFLFEKFESSNIALSMLELQGHGLSDGEHKYIEKFENYVEDLKILIDNHFKDKKIFLMGTSTGALVNALFCQIYGNVYSIKGLIYISPLFKIAFTWYEKLFSSIMSKINPYFAIKAKKENFYNLTHDVINANSLIEESNRTLMGIRIGFIQAFLETREKVFNNFENISKIKTFAYLADQDIILDVKSIEEELRAKYDKPNKLKLQVLSNCYHSILLETKRSEYVENIINWIEKNS